MTSLTEREAIDRDIARCYREIALLQIKARKLDAIAEALRAAKEDEAALDRVDGVLPMRVQA